MCVCVCVCVCVCLITAVFRTILMQPKLSFKWNWADLNT